MNRFLFSVTVLLSLVAHSSQAHAAEMPFNPVPLAVQTPLRPGGPEAALARLSAGSEEKTPTIKEFELEWVRSLAERGEPTVYTRENSNTFEYIGMPVGGIGAGQLYLGGDGKLWWWDIFNTLPRVPGPPAYASPLARSADGPQIDVEQGFAVRTTAGGKTLVKRLEGMPAGALGKRFSLAPGEKATACYLLAWHFPNLRLGEFGTSVVGREYAARFDSAEAVARHAAANLDRLCDETRRWHRTWYDSTLPYWFLDRTFLNTSILATSTSYLLRDGRFYGYEGVYHGPGTCTHVWGYVQAPGRLFPEIEKRLRERVDYNPQIAFDSESGRIGYRSEFNRSDAVDGQSGVILRTYLVHQMSEDDAFLRRNYEPMKRAMDYLIHTYDADEDGILTGGQHNTLDARWYGKITWLSLHYTAALRAAGQMADEMADREYAERVRALADRGRRYIEGNLFNGEYFFHEPDGYIAFSPRLTPEDFRAAFTTAAGWGTFQQKRDGDTQTDTLTLKWGRLRLRALGFDLPEGSQAAEIRVVAAGKPIGARHSSCGRRVFVVLDDPIRIRRDESVLVTLRWAR